MQGREVMKIINKSGDANIALKCNDYIINVNTHLHSCASNHIFNSYKSHKYIKLDMLEVM